MESMENLNGFEIFPKIESEFFLARFSLPK